MRIGCYGKLSNLELSYISFTLYFYYTLKKGFQVMKIRKYLSWEDNWCSYCDNLLRQIWKKVKIVQQNWKRLKNFDICFCMIFDR